MKFSNYSLLWKGWRTETATKCRSAVLHPVQQRSVRYSSEQTPLKTYIRPVPPNHVLNRCYVKQKPSNVNIKSCKNGTNPRSDITCAELHILGKLKAHYKTYTADVNWNILIYTRLQLPSTLLRNLFSTQRTQELRTCCTVEGSR